MAQLDSRRLTRLAPRLAFVLASSLAVVGLLPTAAFASSDEVAASDEVTSSDEVTPQGSALLDMREELVANGVEDLMCGEPLPFSGSFADVLQSQAFANAVCQAQKNYQALAQGYVALQQALGRGADCAAIGLDGSLIKSYGLGVSDKTGENWDQRVTVCFSDVSIWAQRGGTMYGTTFLTSHTQEEFLGRENVADVLLHEQRHTSQWRLLGHDFPGAYLFAGQDACVNAFEIAAGLSDGGYAC